MISMTITEHPYNEYDIKLAEWRGSTVRALTDINDEMKDMHVDIKELDIKVDRINENLTNLRIKVAAIGGASGLIGSLILWLITRVV